MRENDPFPRPLDCVVALILLTRLPLPKLPPPAFAAAARATWAYPLAGMIVGGLACCVWWGLAWLGTPNVIAVLLALCTQILLTGAMHEDGLADSADGLWGGMTRARRLEIMRDSHIGTYGVLALVLTSLLRVFALSATNGLALIAAATLSRAGLPAIMYALPHARDDGLSHSVGRPPLSSVILSLAIGILTCLWLSGPHGIIAAAVAFVTVAAIARVKIGGQTGDILGAAQQVSEIAILIALVTLVPALDP
jgi:adenosylcobinamide-GDP ribazoletransferase